MSFSSLALLALLSSPTVLSSPLQSRASQPPITAVTPAQWAALNQSVSGRLYGGAPLAKPCFPSSSGLGSLPLINGLLSPSCATVQQQWNNDSFIADNFGGYINNNWGSCQAKQCVLDHVVPSNPLAYTAKTCDQGSVAPYYIDVRQPSDVQAAFKFADQTKVPLVVKNSGHDYKGRSSAPNSLALWTHNIQDIALSNSFTPDGCKAPVDGKVVTYQAGIGFLKVYQFAEANDITLLGGSSETVGASGGWIQGAGHGIMTPNMGLGVDNVKQFKVVTPAGDYLTVNECQNQDLFWALRGGGGSTFGVVMETSMGAKPKLTFQVASVAFAGLPLDTTRKFISILIDNQPRWSTEGWGGYIIPAVLPNTGGMVLMTPNLTNAEAKASMKPVTDFVSSLGNIALANEVVESPTFFQAYTKYIIPEEEPVNLGNALASRLIPKDNFATNSSKEQLLDAIMNGLQTVGVDLSGATVNNAGKAGLGGPFQILVTTPVTTPDPAGTTSVTPAWRNALWHTIYFHGWNYDTPYAQQQQYFQTVSKAADFLRAITPAGAYQNEADVNEPNHTESFWGAANYAKLQTIKAKYDPKGLLDCWHCVGWTGASSDRYQCYPPTTSS